MSTDTPARTLGAEIQRLRSKTDFTLRGFAGKIGASAAHLSDIERDRRRPSEKLLRVIVDKLAHVGATHEGLDHLNTRLEPELQRWVSEEPAARQLLRKVFDSDRDPRDIVKQLEKQLGKKDRKK